MPTKLEIYASEQANDGRVVLYPEGMFFKAYEKSAFLLCTKVHPFKVSSRPLKGLDEPLVSVGFPFSSLEKFSDGLQIDSNSTNGGGEVIILFPGIKPDLSGFAEWKSQFLLPENQSPSFGLGLSRRAKGFDGFPIYNTAYRFVQELCVVCSKMQRDYKYSIGEESRLSGMRMLVCLCEALRTMSSAEKLHYLKEAREKLTEVQLSLRLLNDLRIVSDKRYVGFADMSQEITRQLQIWEKSEKASMPE